MSKAQEFAALIAAVRETTQGMTGKVAGALHETNAWVAANADLIARALKRQEAFDRGEPNDDHAGYYSYERDYAAEKLLPLYQERRRVDVFERGFFEGWKAARRFVIQDP